MTFRGVESGEAAGRNKDDTLSGSNTLFCISPSFLSPVQNVAIRYVTESVYVLYAGYFAPLSQSLFSKPPSYLAMCSKVPIA